MINITKILASLFSEQKELIDGSMAITGQDVIEKFVLNTENTFLVSFPRTGSHWLRMIMELYFARPSLVRVFYYPDVTEYLTLHTHDIDLDVERGRVIYLYRDPVDTIFSQLNYYGEPITERERIVYWSDLYGRHLDKWLHSEQFTKHKTILTYEGLKQDIAAEFTKIVQHFGLSLDGKQLAKATGQITKDEVKRKTQHDKQVIPLASTYEVDRREFRNHQGDLVWETLLKDREYLVKCFQNIAVNG